MSADPDPKQDFQPSPAPTRTRSDDTPPAVPPDRPGRPDEAAADGGRDGAVDRGSVQVDRVETDLERLSDRLQATRRDRGPDR